LTIKTLQALTTAFLDGGFSMDVVHKNGSYSVWNGSSYDFFNGVYQPTVGREFAAIHVNPVDTTSMTLNDSVQDDGIFQISLRYPLDSASINTEQKVDEISSIFNVGSRLVYAGHTVHIWRRSRSNGVQSIGDEYSSFYKTIIRYHYRSYPQR